MSLESFVREYDSKYGMGEILECLKQFAVERSEELWDDWYTVAGHIERAIDSIPEEGEYNGT